MITPDFSIFKKLAKQGNLVALSKSVPADLETPVSCFLKLARRSPHAFLLESAEQNETIGRYSFIGLAPRAVLESKSGVTTVRKNGKSHTLGPGERPLSYLERSLAEYTLANPGSVPGFCGGWVGYLGYENVADFETIRLAQKPGPDVPDAIFFLTESLVIFDHFRKILSFVVLLEVPSNKKYWRSAYRTAISRLGLYAEELRRPLKLQHARAGKHPSIRSNMTQSGFTQRVKRIQEYIRAGDCIQVVLSQRFTLEGLREDFPIYRALRSINPSPYMFYFRSGSFRLIGSSPELLVKKIGRTAEVCPIAGTRPRGQTEAQDLRYEENLRKSRKEMAEHLMLVDLGRNDLGRVCQFDTIRVKDFARVERYSHVMHLVSDVTGKLRSGKNAFDLLKSTFPAGTVTGAPKIRAMQIIDELEPERRGPYAGCLGYFSFKQDMDMCLTIRTLVLDGKKVYLQAGAGIVKDSSPEKEFQETVNKASALLKAIAKRGEF